MKRRVLCYIAAGFLVIASAAYRLRGSWIEDRGFEWEFPDFGSGPQDDSWLASFAEARADVNAISIENMQDLHITAEGIRALANLPKLEAIRIYSLRHSLTAEAIGAIARHCPGLRVFEIKYAPDADPPPDGLSLDAIMPLTRLAQLQTLQAPVAEDVDDSFLSALADSCPELETLDLREGRASFTSSGVGALARLPKLETLHLRVGSGRVGDRAVMALAEGGHSLRALTLAGSASVSDVGLSALAESSLKIWFLHLAMTPEAGGAGFMALAQGQADHLMNLSLTGAEGVTDAGLAALANAMPRRLHTLSLDGIAITDAGLAELARLPRLQNLTLARAARITDAGLKALAAFPDLRGVVSLPGSTLITEAGAAEYRRLKPGGKLILPERRVQPYGQSGR